MAKNKKRFRAFLTVHRYRWADEEKTTTTGEFYFLPMLRYMVQGTEDKYLQFKWFIFSFEIKL